jgi:putative methyltransferase (TIGR04325 family)
MALRIVKDLTPPLLRKILNRVRNKYFRTSFVGPIETWGEATQRSTGYEDSFLIENILASALKVKNGEIAFERDGRIFSEIIYSWPVTAYLLKIASSNSNQIEVIDIGGGFGAHYFQNRKMLEHLSDIKWHIVEQNKLVGLGIKNFQDKVLKFYNDINNIIVNSNNVIVLASGVLQYLENPYDYLNFCIEKKVSFILIDRTNFDLSKEDDEVFIQRNNEKKFKSTYPVHLFSFLKFNKFMESHSYILEDRFESRIDSLNFGNSMTLIYRYQLGKNIDNR